MTNKDNGGPAFGEFKQVGEVAIRDGGISIRDYFAAKAMQGAISSLINGEPANSGTDAALAKASYMIADAMLAERAK